jgi:hypothetical protein
MNKNMNAGLAGNPHYELLHKEPMDLGSGQINATLALAHEQRTASLVALLVAGFSTVKVEGIDYSELADEIKMRIGGRRV